MRNATIVGNWKMNKTPSEAGRLASAIRNTLTDHAGAEVVVCPPSIALAAVHSALEESNVAVGAQDVHPESDGAFTGEISAEMAREFATYVIVGHSERRMLFGESDEFISRKVAAVLSAGLRPILCVGEPDEVRSEGRAEEFVDRPARRGPLSRGGRIRRPGRIRAGLGDWHGSGRDTAAPRRR